MRYGYSRYSRRNRYYETDYHLKFNRFNQPILQEKEKEFRDIVYKGDLSEIEDYLIDNDDLFTKYNDELGFEHDLLNDLAYGYMFDNKKNPETIDLLLEYGFDCNSEDEEKRTVIFTLPYSQLGLEEVDHILKSLIDFGCDLNHKDAGGNIPLHVWCERFARNSIESLLKILRETDNVNELNNRGEPPLDVLISAYNFESTAWNNGPDWDEFVYDNACELAHEMLKRGAKPKKTTNEDWNLFKKILMNFDTKELKMYDDYDDYETSLVNKEKKARYGYKKENYDRNVFEL